MGIPLAFNSGAITDGALNSATLTLVNPGAAGSIANSKNIVIDTTAPTVANVVSTNADGSYNAGDVITVRVTFSESVAITGTPIITMDMAGTDRLAY